MTPQSVKDSLADAETLRLAVGVEAQSLLGWYGTGAAWTADHGAWSPWSNGDAGVWARLAARAAFRAVPGLRA